ncbi:hypothetical protein F5X68DRAFT_189817 [Plectosphaerella plurivora]|uniref:Uncharacterized protein n=1 Tax=Plectosphaerella plurivora TaxID=936078 RepID=A0A9P8VE62_9PEZI|nr:hypothetical protein F5X68DRAFT_189817 [Plectosphaerella plurivora]
MAVKRGETPELFYNVLFASREIESFDWVSRDWTEADWQYPPVVGEKNFKGYFIGPPQGLSLTIPVYPRHDVVRTSLVRHFSDSIFAHGEEIPPGEYHLLGRVLRTNGGPHNVKDWQYGLSAWMNITGDLPDPVPEPTTTTAPQVPEPT